MKSTFVQIAELLQQGQPVVVAQIIRQVGSAPRALGTRCIILKDGSIIGTIGGGLLEYKVQQRGKELFASGRTEIYNFKLTSADVAKSDMCCGGIVDVYMEPIFPDNTDTVEIFCKVAALLKNEQRGTLISVIENGRLAGSCAGHLLVAEDGSMAGDLPDIAEHSAVLTKNNKVRLVELSQPARKLFVDPIHSPTELVLFGAGHIATFVAPMAKQVGFRVVVIDDREEFANYERFPGVDEIRVQSFVGIFDQLEVTNKSYFAILTRGHAHDRIVLQAALETDACYIGMVSSARKKALLYQALVDEGSSKERLEEVRTPIGLDIGAETPEEIAVSIVAELIQIRTKAEGGRFFNM